MTDKGVAIPLSETANLGRVAARLETFRGRYQLGRRPLPDLLDLIQFQIDALRKPSRTGYGGAAEALERIAVFALLALEQQAAPPDYTETTLSQEEVRRYLDAAIDGSRKKGRR